MVDGRLLVAEDCAGLSAGSEALSDSVSELGLQATVLPMYASEINDDLRSAVLKHKFAILDADFFKHLGGERLRKMTMQERFVVCRLGF